MKKFIKLMAKHRYSYAFTVLTIIFICYLFNLYNQYNNITGENKTITYQEFKKITKKIKEEHKCLVELTFINSIENMDGKIIYKYEIKPKESIRLIDGDILNISQNYNNYFFSDKKIDIEKDTLYEAKAIVTAIFCPSFFKDVPYRTFYCKNCSEKVPLLFEEILINEKHFVDGYVNITLPKFEKNNKINYNFINKDLSIEKDLKEEIYEKYIKKTNEKNQKNIEDKQSFIILKGLFGLFVCFLIFVFSYQSYSNARKMKRVDKIE